MVEIVNRKANSSRSVHSVQSRDINSTNQQTYARLDKGPFEFINLHCLALGTSCLNKNTHIFRQLKICHEKANRNGYITLLFPFTLLQKFFIKYLMVEALHEGIQSVIFRIVERTPVHSITSKGLDSRTDDVRYLCGPLTLVEQTCRGFI
jgi:hypothetical protein